MEDIRKRGYLIHKSSACIIVDQENDDYDTGISAPHAFFEIL